jgi:hypothetical protein
MLDIHQSSERFFKDNLLPVVVTHHPYNGKPFSEYYLLTKGNRELCVTFGTGGFYPKAAYQEIMEYFKEA